MPIESHIRLFIEHVLPLDDPALFIGIATHDQKTGIWAGNAARSLSEAVSQAIYLMEKGNNVFCVLSMQREARQPKEASEGRKAGRWLRVQRGADNAVSMRCLWADIDLRSAKHPTHPFTTRDEAIAGIDKFCAAINLPRPTLRVDSGHGNLHIYWRLDRTLSKGEWSVLASKLANALRHHGIHSEMVTDANTALRIPTGVNYKYNMPVRMEKPDGERAVADMETALATFGLRVVPTSPETAINDEFSSGITGQAPPVDLYAVAEAGCGVFLDAIAFGGKDHDEPLWSRLLYGATFATNPEYIAHEMSEHHPSYDHDETQAKFEEKVAYRQNNPRFGWPTCEEFNRVSPICKTCPFWGKIKSPFNLMKLDGVAHPDPAASDDLPDQYQRSAASFIMGNVGNKKDGYKQQVIIPFQLRDSRVAWDDEIEEEVLSFEVFVMDRWRFVRVPTSTVNSQLGLMEVLGRAGMTCHPDLVKYVRGFFVAWVQKIMERKQRSTVHFLGWNEGDGFSYNRKLFSAKGERPAFYGRPLPKGYEPKGEIEPWKKAAKFITDQKRPALDCILASAFAGPLIKLSIDQGVIFSVWGSETGQGKSTTLKIAQAVWGDPSTGINGLEDTPNSITRKAADLRHLPMYWDELKTKDQYTKMVSLAFELAAGKSKSRLGRNANPLEVRAFSNMLTAVSNASLFNIVVNHTAGTEAGAMRVFEVRVPPTPSNERSDMVPVWALDRGVKMNYGCAGELYAKYIGEHEAEIEERLSMISTLVAKRGRASAEERFWLAAISCLVVGAELAKKLGLVDIDIGGMSAFLWQSMLQARARMKAHVTVMHTKEHGELFIGRLIQETWGRHLLQTSIIWDQPSKPPDSAVNVYGTDVRLTNPWVQLGLQDNKLRVVKKAFKDYVDKQGQNIDEVLEVLKAHFGLVEKRSIGTGCPGHYGSLAKARDYCWQIQLPAEFTVDPSDPYASPGYHAP